MKHYLYLATIILLASCNGNQSKSPTLSMDPDFEPNEPHPFVERVETASGMKLSSQDLLLHGDTLGTLIIERAESDPGEDLLHAFTYRDAEGHTGTVTCQYNDFNELTDLWIECPTERTHSLLQWNEDGNLNAINQESWREDDTHTMQVIEYRYTKQSAYGNWYAGMAEQLGGPIAILFHAGLLGRAPWTLPDAITILTSVISNDMIGEQATSSLEPEYSLDRNGRVEGEKVGAVAYSYRY